MAAWLTSFSDHAAPFARASLLLAVGVEHDGESTAPPRLRCPARGPLPAHKSSLVEAGAQFWRPADDATPGALMRGVLLAAQNATMGGRSSLHHQLVLLKPEHLREWRGCAIDGWGSNTTGLTTNTTTAQAPPLPSPLMALRLARRLAAQLSHAARQQQLRSTPAVGRLPSLSRTRSMSCRLPLRRGNDASSPLAAFLELSGGGGGGGSEVGAASAVTARARGGASLGASLGTSALREIAATSSTTACAARLRGDIGDGLAASVRSTLETTFVMTLIKAVAIPLLMLLCIPFVVALLEALMPHLSPVLGPGMIAAAEPILVMFLHPKIYGPVGEGLISLAAKGLNARAGGMLSRSLAFHLPRVLTASIPPKLTEYMMKAWAPEAAKSLVYSTLHALTHSLTHSLSHHLTQAVVQGVTHSITHSLIHYYYCIYCYKSGDFCRYCYFCEPQQLLSNQSRLRGSHARPSDRRSLTRFLLILGR